MTYPRECFENNTLPHGSVEALVFLVVSHISHFH
jgi:hypothetical protein